MDCETFDRVLLELVDDELEMSALGSNGDARVHMEGCVRCRARWAAWGQEQEKLAPTHLTVVEGLEKQILPEVPTQEPPSGWVKRLDQLLSQAGSYAMRPQLSMGLLLLLMVGTSLLLLRARPARPGSVVVTERGVPLPVQGDHAETEPLSSVPWRDYRYPPTMAGSRREDERTLQGPGRVEAPTKETARGNAEKTGIASEDGNMDDQPTPAVAATLTTETVAAPPGSGQDATFRAAMDDFRAQRFAEAQVGFDMVVNGGGPQAPVAALYAARSIRSTAGCGVAAAKFDGAANRFAGTNAAADAIWEAAQCYRELGQIDRSRQLLQVLRRTPRVAPSSQTEAQ